MTLHTHPAAKVPSDDVSELALLGWATTAKADQVHWLREDLGVVPEHLYRPLHQDVLRWVYQRHAAKNPYTPADLLQWVRSDERRAERFGADLRPLLSGLTDHACAYADDAEKCAHRIRDGHIRREIIHRGQEMIRAAREAIDAEEALRQADEAGRTLRTLGTSKSRVVSLEQVLDEVLSDVYDRIESHREGVSAALPTGFPAIDRKLGGGLEPGDLVFVAGRPSMGKTSFAQTVLIKAAVWALQTDQRGSLLFFSAEMDRIKLGRRILSEATGVNTRDMRSGRITEADLIALGTARDRLRTLDIWIDDTPRPTMRYMRQIMRQREYAAGRLLCVGVDYLQILGRETGRAQHEELGALSGGMKAAAKEFQTPVIVLAQLNRECEGRPTKKPVAKDLKGSGDMEQDADVILFPFRAAVYDENADVGLGEIIIAKARDGQIGPVPVLWDAQNGFYSPAPEVDTRHDPNGYGAPPAPSRFEGEGWE